MAAGCELMSGAEMTRKGRQNEKKLRECKGRLEGDEKTEGAS